MQQERNKKIAAVFWILSAICMAVIFWLSSRTADESKEQSAFFLNLLTKLFGDGAFTDFIVRKLAHCLEFTGTCLLLSAALYFTRDMSLVPFSVAIASCYAVTDEIHQLFVEGRSCEFRDWFIDTAGACAGLLLFLIIRRIVIKVKTKGLTEK
jgi:VanZ family protein